MNAYLLYSKETYQTAPGYRALEALAVVKTQFDVAQKTGQQYINTLIGVSKVNLGFLSFYVAHETLSPTLFNI